MNKSNVTVKNEYNPYDNYYRPKDINPRISSGGWLIDALKTEFKNNTIVYKNNYDRR